MGYIATIGFFDGVHMGHRFLIAELQRMAVAEGLQSAVLTFDEHPQTVLTGEAQPLLSTFEERKILLQASGVDEIFSFHFDVIQQMTAEEFMQVLRARCGVEVLLMGYDHQFGSDQMTDFADYEAAASRVGLRLQAIPAAPEGEVSSSKIRRALMAGDIERANAMLGYAYTLTGQVGHGRGLGRQLGFPTANIALPQDKLLPAHGVYEALVSEGVSEGVSERVSEGVSEEVRERVALLNIGTNPTVGNDQVTVEVHIPDFEGDLYGETLSVHLMHRLRDEQRFDSLDQLQRQIKADIDSILHQDAD